MQSDFDNIDRNDNNLAKPFVAFEDAWSALKPELDREAKRRKERKKRIVFFLFSLLIMGLVGGFILKNAKFSSTSIAIKNKSVSPNIKTDNMGNLLPLIVGNTMTKLTSTRKIDKIVKNDQNGNNEISLASGLKVNGNVVKRMDKLSDNVLVLNDKAIRNNRNKLVAKDKRKIADQTFLETKNSPSNNVGLVQNSKVESSPSNNQSSDFKPYVQDDKEVKLKTTKNDSLNHGFHNTALTDSISKVAKLNNNKEVPYHYGVEFGLPIQANMNTLDINGKKQPLSLLIPTFWGSVKLTDKQTLLLRINPYSQFYSNKKTTINISKYETTIQHAATITDNPLSNSYTQVIAINKLIALQTSLSYQYQFTTKLKACFGVGFNLLQGSILENKVIENNMQVKTDNLYGIDRNNKEWKFMKSDFFTANIELAYQLKKAEIGINSVSPIGNVVNTNVENTSFVNIGMFIRWQLK